MATIRTALALYDGMSRPLRSIYNAMDIVLNSFENLQDASRSAVDTAALQRAREELTRSRTALDELADPIRDADREQQRLNGHIRDGTGNAENLLSKVKGIALTLGGLAGLKKLVELSDTQASTTARLNLIVDDGGSVGELEAKIMASAQRSRAAYFDTAAAVASMGANAKSAFSGNDELIAFLEQINKQFVIGGASAEGQAAAMLQLTQAMGAGALRGEELNSILENAPGIARAIERYMGAAEGSIKSYAEEGLITAEVVKNAMFAAADETNAKFDSMPKTWAQVATSMQNTALTLFSPVLQRLNEIANSEQFQRVASGILGGLALVAQVAAEVLDLMLSAANLIAENWSWIEPIILGVAAAMLFYLAVTKGALVVEAVSGALKAAHAAVVNFLSIGYGVLTGSTAAASAATLVFNSALMASPITWIVLAVIALIAVLYAAVGAMNHFAGTSVSATGIVCGAFMAALAFVGNLFIVFYNLVVDVFVLIYNLIAAVANFIATVFDDPVAAVCHLFFDLADTVLSVLQSLASAIDTVFGSNLAGAVQNWRNSLGGWVDKTFGKGVEVMEKMDAQQMHLQRFEYSAAWDKGYSFGKGLGEKVSNLFKAPDLGKGEGYDLGNVLDQIQNAAGDTAGNTADMADALDLTKEELKLLREIAEREAINRFTTAEIKVEMTNHNNVSGTQDLDGIVSDLEKKLEEAMIEVSEGVHI
ncbi:MAG: tape measure protein [Ruminiclostridium sp.]|jgi:tape measure domain-containing protein|nr:tape measure protein [Ruminiclostridium sp.]